MGSGVQAARSQSDLEVSTVCLPKRTGKDRSQFFLVLRQHVERLGIDVGASVLVVGGMPEDAEVLRRCGFHRITLSNIEGTTGGDGQPGEFPIEAVDAEDIRLSDNSYDMVVVHEVIHHCRSPHRALCEMLRVAKRYVVMMEPNDSTFMRLLGRLGFSFPYELFAVVDNDYVCGGVRNSQIPNFIHRWNRHDVFKTASSFLAERMFSVRAYPYWDFNVDERDLAYRKQTRIELITRLIGARNFIRLLRITQTVLNRVPILRRQGNKFFCCIEKSAELRPWLIQNDAGDVVFDRSFQSRLD
jgi:SAM-dependent methyltransferase